jgi:hypothetical protein
MMKESREGWYVDLSSPRHDLPLAASTLGNEIKHQEYKGQIDSVHCFSAVGSALPGRAA